MNRFYRHPLLTAVALWLIAQGCSFFTNPEEAEDFGELQINLRFAGAGTENVTNSSLSNEIGERYAEVLAKETVPQAVDRVVIIILGHPHEQLGEFSQSELIRREFRIGSDRKLQATIQVPLQRAQLNCFIVRVQAFEGVKLLYTGEDYPCFDEQNKRVAANIILEPVAFRVDLPVNIPPTSSRIVTLTGQVRDTTITRIQIIMADSVTVNFPPAKGSFFSNPVMLFGDKSLITINAFSGNNFVGSASRQVTYTGTKAEVLVALVWDQPVDLDLEVVNPLQQVISAAAPGDSVGGGGRLQVSDTDGYGPEVYEWRSVRITGGSFSVRVARPRTGLPTASGKVYIFFREGQIRQSVRSFRFAFVPQDTQLFQTIHNFTWPIP
ncbi:MAG: hypothetical protein ONB44_17120 [candidate division KSB1 bacterium]|nr:hypothetical protein [candidate division KSB1 bacterium]MDZ7303857.1 hypothetical protein [candidate division KSB1 bacterium]MDZ7312758.1 hypothetical protein [candidate division KSB1 bacterium]